MDRFSISKEVQFCAGHRIPNHTSKCRNVHGHQYRLKVKVEGPLVLQNVSSQGMVVDFGLVKRELTKLADLFDHRFIMCSMDVKLAALFKAVRSRSSNVLGAAYYVEDFGWVQETPGPPTAENLAYYCFQWLSEVLNRDEQRVRLVKIWETPTSMAEYRAD
jgi:6-pyruvoyltetrahydropterin/6-carboxytetrahydropterin synthase